MHTDAKPRIPLDNSVGEMRRRGRLAPIDETLIVNHCGLAAPVLGPTSR